MSKNKGKIIAFLVAAVVLGVGCSFLVPQIFSSKNNTSLGKSDDSTISDTSSNLVNETYGEFDEENIGELYYAPIDPEHIAEDENGIMYSDNEILVVADDGVGFSEIEALAKEYNAEIVGFIEQTGDYQWKFADKLSLYEIEALSSELCANDIILEANYNYISNAPSDLLFDIDPGDEWTMAGIDFMLPDTAAEKNKRSWSFKSINAQAAWFYLMSIKNDVYPVKVGLIDDCFNINHEDLGFAKDSNGIIQVFPQSGDGNPIDGQEADRRSPGNYVKTKASSHGTHVAGTMAASSKDNKGICGIYPYGDGNLYAFSWRAGLENDKVSAMAEKIWFSELILRNVKVINCSYGNSPSLYYNDEQAKKRIKDEADSLGSFLNRLINIGYDFVITASSGNESNDYVITLSCTKNGDLAYFDNGTDHSIPYDSNGEPEIVRLGSDGNYYYDRTIDEDVTISYLITGITGSDQVFHPADDVNDTKDHHLNSQYASCLTAIDTSDVKDRIIVVGAVDSNYDITYYSNTGDRTDIYAPGGIDNKQVFSCYNDNSYGYMMGTSMAAPHVAGVAANVWSVNNSLSGKQVKDIICNSIHDNSKDGYPVVDAYKAIDNALKETGMSNSHGEYGALMGWVVDESSLDADGEPLKISDVEISVYKTGESDVLKLDNNDTIIKSDKYGHFELLLDEGTYNIKASHKDYGETLIENVSVMKNEVTYCEYVVLKETFKDTRVLIPGEDTIRTASVNTVNDPEAEKYAQIVINNEKLWYDPWLSDGDEYAPINSTYAWFQDLNFDGKLEFIVGTQNIMGQSMLYGFDIFEFTNEGKMHKITDGNTMIYDRSIIFSPHFDGVRAGMPGFVYESDGKYTYIYDDVNNSISTTGFRMSELTIVKGNISTNTLFDYLYAEPGETIEYYKYKDKNLSKKEMISKLEEQINNSTFYRAKIGTVPFSDKEAWITDPNDETLSDAAGAVISACYDGLSDKEKLQAFVDSYNAYSLVECDWNYFELMHDELNSILPTNNSLSESDLKNMIENSSSGTLYSWDYADYDGDGNKEAFANFVDEYSYFKEIRFIDSDGNITVMRDEPFGMFTSNIVGVDYEGRRFATLSSALGQAWRDRTLIYGVKDNVPYELILSGEINDLYIQNGKPYTNEYQFGDNAQIDFWAVPLELKYDADSKEFLL